MSELNEKWPSDDPGSQQIEDSLNTLCPEEVNYDPGQFTELCAGRLFGEYRNFRLCRKIGEGGMGQTWLAEELAGGEVTRSVVLKILSRELQRNAGAMNEVRRVFDLTASLNHSHICPLHGRFRDPDLGDFLVMAYADGGTLREWFLAQRGHEDGLYWKRVFPILRPIAEALDHAHRMGVVHRDVKPQNIVFMKHVSGNVPLLIDFGIAARIAPAMVQEKAETFSRLDPMGRSSSGTPRYMAPEQMKGEKQDGRTDQYALALVLYELLRGSLPFSETNVVKLAIEKLRFIPKDPRFPHKVNAVFRRALSASPARRFSTCTEFLDELEAAFLEWESTVKNASDPVSSTHPRFLRPSAAPLPPSEPQTGVSQTEVSQTGVSQTEILQTEISSASETIPGTPLPSDAKSRADAGKMNDEMNDEKNDEKNDGKNDGKKVVWGCLFLFLCPFFLSFISEIVGCWAETRPAILSAANEKVLNSAPKRFRSDHYEVPEGIQRIDSFAFFGRTTLKSVKLPVGTKVIDDYAFQGCSALESVTFPENLSVVGSGAFKDCSSLRSVDLPASVTIIREGTFQGCSALESVTFPENLSVVGSGAFRDCTSLRSIDLPASVTWVGEYAFSGCTAMQTLTIRNPEAEIEFFEWSSCSYEMQNLKICTPKRSKVWKAAEKAGYECVPLED